MILITAISSNKVIGKSSSLPFCLKDDLSHFKQLTQNSIVIMGRNTFESIGKPLNNRINYVLSSSLQQQKGIVIFRSIETLKQRLITEDKKVFVIGGAEVYKLFEYDYKEMYITKVQTNIQGDDLVFFPHIDLSRFRATKILTKQKDKNNEFDFEIWHYKRKPF